MSKIEWTNKTWNPVVGCTRASAGCDNCYAVRETARQERIAKARQAEGKNAGRSAHYIGLTVVNNRDERHFNGTVRTVPEALEEPLRWRKPLIIFVNSMADLFHRDVPLAFIQRVFEIMNRCPQHHFQIVTKRPERAAQLAPYLNWTPNIWIGTSVEDARVTSRIAALRKVPAHVRFLSVEPLIGPLPRLALSKIDWVIVGGESGKHARPMDAKWVRDIRDRCVERGIPFFFKQWGKLANNPDPRDPTVKRKNSGTAKGGRILDGRTWDEMPACVAVPQIAEAGRPAVHSHRHRLPA